MKGYKIIYEDGNKLQDSICIKSNCKPNKIDAKHILSRFHITKCKIIEIIPLD